MIKAVFASFQEIKRVLWPKSPEVAKVGMFVVAATSLLAVGFFIFDGIVQACLNILTEAAHG